METQSEIEMVEVKSSNIAAVGYDRKSKTLRVRFHYNQMLYDYEGVPASVHKQLMAAQSKGDFFHKVIFSSRYTMRRVA